MCIACDPHIIDIMGRISPKNPEQTKETKEGIPRAGINLIYSILIRRENNITLYIRLRGISVLP